MNQCDKTIKELLPLYIDGELTKEEKALVDAHILACSDCNEELELYQMMHDEFFLGGVQAPEGFHEDLMNRLDIAAPLEKKTTKQRKTSLYYRYNKYINVAAMLVFVMLLSVIGLTQGNKWSDSYNSSKMDTATESTFSAEVAESKEESVEAVNEEMRMGVNSVEESQEVFAMEAPQEDLNVQTTEIDLNSAVTEETVDSVNDEVVFEAQKADEKVAGVQEAQDTQVVLDAEYGDSKELVESEVVTSYTLLDEDTDTANKEKTAKILVEPQGEQDYTALATQSPTGPSWTLIIGGILLGLCLVTIIIFLIRKHYFKK